MNDAAFNTRGNRGDWIQTYTGRRFYPLDPQPDDICIEDIAHALALTCRYNGHSREFYSVSEHAVRMSRADLPGSPAWRLMHDAAEAYLSDVPRPIKPMLPEFYVIENSILNVIACRFDLGELPREIKHADMVMLATERRDVLVQGGPEWGIDLPEPLPFPIQPWSWLKSEIEFLCRAEELGIK